MNLPTEIFGNVIVAHTPEDLGADQADALEGFLVSLERTQIVIDLDGTETIDSAGLTALLDARDALRELQGDIRISATNTANRTILRITRLDEQLDVFDSVIDAVKSYS